MLFMPRALMDFSLKIVQKLRYFVIVSVLFIFHWDLIAYDMRNIIMKYNIYDWLEIELQISNIRTFDRRLPSVYVTLFVLMAFDKPVFPNFRWCSFFVSNYFWHLQMMVNVSKYCTFRMLQHSTALYVQFEHRTSIGGKRALSFDTWVQEAICC